jgi:hypothetical protein
MGNFVPKLMFIKAIKDNAIIRTWLLYDKKGVRKKHV